MTVDHSVRPLVQRPERLARAVAEGVGVAGIAALAAAVMLGMHHTSPRVPRVYSGDSLSGASWVKGIVETGWVNANPRLGAPFGQVHYDYPLGGDNLHFLMMRAMALVTGDWVLIMNMFFLASFATAAFAAYLALRWFAVGRLLAGVVALVFAFTPYHFVRGPEHLLLSSYFVVPIAVVVAARVFTGFTRGPDAPGLVSVATVVRALPWAVALAVVGSCGAYYALFSVLLIGVVAALGAVVARSLQPLWAGMLAAAGICATLGLNLSGSVRYRRAHGVNEAVATRAAIELDGYPLRFADLLTPLRESRVPGAGTLADRVTLPMASSLGQYQGVLGALCLLGLAAWIVLRASRPADDPTRHVLAVGVLTFVVVGTAGGAAWFGNLVGFTQLRVLSRASIFITFLLLTWGALTVAPVVRGWVADSGRRMWAARAIAVVLVALAWFDQVPSPVTRHPNAGEALAADRDYFVGIESEFEPGSAVFILPVRGYPEEPAVVNSYDYDLLRPYLSTQSLRFSYGGIKGREMEWQRGLDDSDPTTLVADLSAAGFAGLLVDRYGYVDQAVALLGALAGDLGEPRTDATGRWAFLDLRPVGAVLRAQKGDAAFQRLGQTVLEDPVVHTGECGWPEPYGEIPAVWCPATTTVELRSASRPVRARFTGQMYAASNTTVTISTAEGSTEVPIGPEFGEFALELDVSPNGTSVTFATADELAPVVANFAIRAIGLDAEVIDVVETG